MSLAFSTDEVDLGDARLRGALAELDNAVIAIFWDGEAPSLGTLTVTLPNGISSLLLGDRHQLLGQILGEHLAAARGKMAIVSTKIATTTEGAAAKPLIDLARRLAAGRGGSGRG